MNNVASPAATHPFQLAGLGTAPFRVIGLRECVYQACPGAPVQAGSSCDFCGTGIRWVYGIQGSGPSDRPFKVGCDCVRRADPALGQACRVARRDYLNDIRFAAERKAKAERLAAREAKLKAARKEGAKRLQAALRAMGELRALVIRAAHRADDKRAVAVELIQKWIAFGLSEKQIAFLCDLGRASAPAPEGRVAVVGVVASVKVDEFYGSVKARVVCDGGYSVWTTLPASCLGEHRIVAGKSRVSFTAKLTRSDTDPTFAFASRPTKGAYLGEIEPNPWQE